MTFKNFLMIKVLRVYYFVYLLIDSYAFAREIHLLFGLSTVDDLLGEHSWWCFTSRLDLYWFDCYFHDFAVIKLFVLLLDAVSFDVFGRVMDSNSTILTICPPVEVITAARLRKTNLAELIASTHLDSIWFSIIFKSYQWSFFFLRHPFTILTSHSWACQ
jgi:hypothetical protein